MVAALAFVLPALSLSEVHSQETRRRWERMCQIRKDEFDLILSRIGQIGFLIGDKRAGLFNFEIAWVGAVKEG